MHDPGLQHTHPQLASRSAAATDGRRLHGPRALPRTLGYYARADQRRAARAISSPAWTSARCSARCWRTQFAEMWQVLAGRRRGGPIRTASRPRRGRRRQRPPGARHPRCRRAPTRSSTAPPACTSSSAARRRGQPRRDMLGPHAARSLHPRATCRDRVRGVLFANELLDALPAPRRHAGRWLARDLRRRSTATGWSTREGPPSTADRRVPRDRRAAARTGLVRRSEPRAADWIAGRAPACARIPAVHRLRARRLDALLRVPRDRHADHLPAARQRAAGGWPRLAARAGRARHHLARGPHRRGRWRTRRRLGPARRGRPDLLPARPRPRRASRRARRRRRARGRLAPPGAEDAR